MRFFIRLRNSILVILFILTFFILSTKTFAEEKITKIAENNVQVQKIYYDKTGMVEYVADTESYGENRVNEELKKTNQEIADWGNSQYIVKKLNSLNKKRDKLLRIKAKLGIKAKLPIEAIK